MPGKAKSGNRQANHIDAKESTDQFLAAAGFSYTPRNDLKAIDFGKSKPKGTKSSSGGTQNRPTPATHQNQSPSPEGQKHLVLVSSSKNVNQAHQESYPAHIYGGNSLRKEVSAKGQEKGSEQRNRNTTLNGQYASPANVSSKISAVAVILERTSDVSLPSINLVAHRAPRENRDFEGSTDPSLPSISGWEGSDSGAERNCGDLLAPQLEQSHDVRNQIGLKPNQSGDEDNWHRFSHTADKGSDSEFFCTGRYVQNFIKAWRENCPQFPTVDLNRAASLKHWDRDIDTTSGNFLTPVDYQTCYASLSRQSGAPGKDRGLEWRRLTWSSTLLMRRKADLKSYDKAKRGHDWPKFPTPDDDPDLIEIRRKHIEEINAQLPGYSLCSPRVPCYLRPAQPGDMQEVLDIYNHEVQFGCQAPDSEHVPLQDFIRIYEDTQKLGLPFLVAVYGSARELKTTTGNVELTHCTPAPEARAPPVRSLVGKVIGFAYLSVWYPGLGGSGQGASRASAKVNVHVHHDFLRKRIGYSLLDKLLSTTSTRFSTASSYDFVDVSNNPVYKSSRDHERKTWRLYLAHNVPHGTSRDPKDILNTSFFKTLQDVFNFELLARLDMAYRTPTTRPGGATWLDSMLFQHECHLGRDFFEVDNY